MTTGLIALAVALSISFSTLGPAIGMGNAGGKALEGMSRQPEIMGQLRTNMIIACAFMETLTIYGLVLEIMLRANM